MSNTPESRPRESWTAPLSKHEIEMVRNYGTHIVPYERRPEVVIALCDTALASLTPSERGNTLLREVYDALDSDFQLKNPDLWMRLDAALKNAAPQAATAAPHDKRRMAAPTPTDDDLEAALRQEYGGTPNTDALIDVVMPLLRARGCTPSAETCSERSLRDLMDDVRRLGSNFNNAEILLAWKTSHPDFHIISSDRSPDV